MSFISYFAIDYISGSFLDVSYDVIDITDDMKKVETSIFRYFNHYKLEIVLITM